MGLGLTPRPQLLRSCHAHMTEEGGPQAAHRTAQCCVACVAGLQLTRSSHVIKSNSTRGRTHRSSAARWLVLAAGQGAHSWPT